LEDAQEQFRWKAVDIVRVTWHIDNENLQYLGKSLCSDEKKERSTSASAPSLKPP
jgi:hypothetical protein